jgi:Amt family ammonium transporter
MAIGLIAGLVCNLFAVLMKRAPIDDTLDVFACHGVGGILGALLTGVFCTKAVNPAGADGLLYGNPKQFLIQLAAVVVVAVWGFVTSVLLLKVINKVMKLRVSVADEHLGLDLAQHGEAAYQGSWK